jgi:hypothetical protein
LRIVDTVLCAGLDDGLVPKTPACIAAGAAVIAPSGFDLDHLPTYRGRASCGCDHPRAGEADNDVRPRAGESDRLRSTARLIDPKSSLR